MCGFSAVSQLLLKLAFAKRAQRHLFSKLTTLEYKKGKRQKSSCSIGPASPETSMALRPVSVSLRSDSPEVCEDVTD